MFETTSEMIARVLARDAEERAGAGGTVRMTKAVHRAVPLGHVYPVSQRVAMSHYVDFHFSDGSVKTYGPTFHSSPRAGV